ncbi:MAG TPA: hypothetical protein VGR19_05950 [Allosphingosinicella sp.]|nr:hypothetical protein [Allosphingosinicella sp.]
MITRRQFVSVRFHPADRRTYTYHNDGEPVQEGDRVVVSTAKGPAVVEVMGVFADDPPFETKPIVGKERPPADSDTPQPEKPQP